MNAPKRPDRQRPERQWSFRLRITLLDVKPAVWREVLVPETITLPKLHMVFQHAMGWTNSHLHEFVIQGQHYTDYLEDDWWREKQIDERRVRLQAALGRVARTFDYLYDFGDGWHHAVVVEDREPNPAGAIARVRCLAGERACPPEDVGGVQGYADFLDAIDDPRHPEHEQCLTWCGGAFDPDRFDIERVNELLGRIKA